MKRRHMLVSIGSGIVLAGCTGSAGTETDATDSETATETPMATATRTDAPTASPTSSPTETGTPAASSAIDVAASGADRRGDGTLTIEWRPVTFQAFTWDSADGQFYDDRAGERYLIVQLRLSASGQAADVDLENLEAVVDGDSLGRQAFTGELEVSSAIEPESPVAGWRAWSIPESIEAVELRHAASSRSYTTTFERSAALELDVEAV